MGMAGRWVGEIKLEEEVVAMRCGLGWEIYLSMVVDGK